MKIAIIIKHPYRATDWRVDIAEVDDDISYNQIHKEVMRTMLGPFEIMGITNRINFDRKIEIKKPGELG